MKDSDTPSRESLRIHLYLRGRAPADAMNRLLSLVDRARRLEEIDRISDVTVTTWSSVRPVLERIADEPASVTATVAAFRSWADREGYRLEPAFRRRETSSMLEAVAEAEAEPDDSTDSEPDLDHDTTANTFQELRVPTICAAVYADDSLEFVVPCSDGDRTYSVEECLRALETDVFDRFPRAVDQEWVRGAGPDAGPARESSSGGGSGVAPREDTEGSAFDG